MTRTNFLEHPTKSFHHRPPACVGVDEVAVMLGWPNYFIPILVNLGHLKPLGKPAKNAHKWFATVEIVRLCDDVDWLDKAIRLVNKSVQAMNQRQRKDQKAAGNAQVIL